MSGSSWILSTDICNLCTQDSIMMQITIAKYDEFSHEATSERYQKVSMSLTVHAVLTYS